MSVGYRSHAQVYMINYKISIFIQSGGYSLDSLRRTRRIVTDRSVDNAIHMVLLFRSLMLEVTPE